LDIDISEQDSSDYGIPLVCLCAPNAGNAQTAVAVGTIGNMSVPGSEMMMKCYSPILFSYFFIEKCW
jgi:hypothetical protein